MADDTSTSSKSLKKRRRPDPEPSLERPELPFKIRLKPDASVLKALDTLVSAATNSPIYPSPPSSQRSSPLYSLSPMGMGGKAILPNVDRVGDMQSDALFLLLVEKDAVYMRLAEDRFYSRFPCIIVTAKGQPDVATRLFLRKMKMELKLPVLALVDSDPYGLKILSVYGRGSKNISYDSVNLTTLDMKWLGIRPSDLDKYKVPKQCRLPMTEQDIKTGKDLLEDFVKKNPWWVEGLELMVKTKQKAEIQASKFIGHM